MNRRELLQMIMSATGYAMIGSPVLLTACASSTGYQSAAFADNDQMLLSDIADTILPRTSTPGARDADVAPFMTKIVDDCYSDAEQAIFHEGLAVFREQCLVRFGQNFAALTDEQRTGFLSELDQVARAYPRPTGSPVHYFVMIKQLTLFAYFTSEIVQTQVLRLVPVPGRYDGCYPYQEGETAWAI